MSEGAVGGIGDAVSGQPTGGLPTPVARGGYQPPGPQFLEVDGQRWDADQIRQGALMQSDYTRKTQELASQRQELEQQRAYSEAASQLIGALQNPATAASTILQLAEASGVDLGEALSGQGQGGFDPYGGGQDYADEGDIDPNSPIGQRIAALEEQVQQAIGQAEGLETEQIEQWLDDELAGQAPVFEALGVPFDPEMVMQYAVEHETADVATAAQAMLFEQLVMGGQAPSAQGQQGFGQPGGYAPQGPLPQAQPAAALPPDARRLFAAQTPHGGMQGGAPASAPAPQPSSYAEAINQTLAQLGIGVDEFRPD